MKLTESYRRRIQELAGIDVNNFDHISEEEYQSQLNLKTICSTNVCR